MTNEWWIGKDVEGSGHSVSDGINPAITWRHWENHENLQNNCLCLDRDSNQTPPIYRSEAFQLMPACSVPTCMCHSHPIHMSGPPWSAWSRCSNKSWWHVQLQSSSKCNIQKFPLKSSFLGWFIFLATLFTKHLCPLRLWESHRKQMPTVLYSKNQIALILLAAC